MTNSKGAWHDTLLNDDRCGAAVGDRIERYLLTPIRPRSAWRRRSAAPVPIEVSFRRMIQYTIDRSNPLMM